MVNQFNAALCLGRGSDGLVDDDAARAGAAAAKWVLGELRTAFPEVEWRLPASIVELDDIPATSDALLDALPARTPIGHDGPGADAKAGDLGDWLRRLAAAILRWLAGACTQLADWLTSKVPVTGSGEQGREAESREEELVGDC